MRPHLRSILSLLILRRPVHEQQDGNECFYFFEFLLSFAFFPIPCFLSPVACSLFPYFKNRIRPRGFRSAFRILRRSLSAARMVSAARCPLRAALSMVEGQPVAIQSPARTQFGQGDMELGRAASIPGGTVKVARTSLTSAAFSSFASLAAGKNSLSSATASSIACSRLERGEFARGAHDQLKITALCFAPGCKRLLLYIQ